MSAAGSDLLLALADDDFVLGFADSEWTGIAPHLEEDVAMSSLAQDELGHASAYYGLLADRTGGDPDRIAYDRPADAFRHARLVDHGRGDWARTMTRRWLYDTANAVRLEALADSSDRALAELVVKVRREETYHLLHGQAWVERLAGYDGEPRRRLIEALDLVGPDAPSVLAALPGEASLVADGILPVASAELRERWLERVEPVLAGLGLALPPPAAAALDPATARSGHGPAFGALFAEFSSVRGLDRAAAW
ncbi:MAG TPA: 1,2-phenylacetyl-CoA epoxidase subunit PaaC [Candidatus Limnocylindrales bacterium]|nr:1,2-phenylacetyl-CoA epoxidase subunit PaaC [Candidatus Limnocylindrales bacterium]